MIFAYYRRKAQPLYKSFSKLKFNWIIADRMQIVGCANGGYPYDLRKELQKQYDIKFVGHSPNLVDNLSAIIHN